MNSMLDARPRVAGPLDPGFAPAALANRRYRDAVKKAGKGVPVAIAVERENGLVYRSDLAVLPQNAATDADTLKVVERHIKSLLWAVGGWRVFVSGPSYIGEYIRQAYKTGGARGFDTDVMATSYDRAFAVEVVGASDVPKRRESASPIGGHLEGCRIGFDLGASDYKLAAVVNGEAVFSTEIPWTPSVQKDPSYHFTYIMKGLKEAAAHMPRVDAIGGSAAGIYVDNRPKIGSLFRSVPKDLFAAKVNPMFVEMQKEWGVPFVVANDGDVTALAGAMSLKRNAMLGIAMGSSQAGGFLNAKGCITGQLNELAFVPVDFNPAAVADEWSGDRGVGALYFSQQAVNKLAPSAGFLLPADMPLPERLKAIQAKADGGDAAAEKIFATIGVYLGYGLAHYTDYYDYENVLVLGRVMSGRGGEIIIAKAREVMEAEFPEIAARVSIHIPDEASRRVGQAVAAASLPEIGKRKKTARRK